MKKAKKGLLLSLFTLIVAVAITATSTYAWFIVNRSVQATNMQLTLTSDTTYLVIGTAASTPASVNDIGTETSVAATASAASVLPVRYNESATPSQGNSKWETASGTGYANGAASGGYTAVATANVGNYAIHYTFYVGLTSTSTSDQANLKVTALTATNGTASATFLPAVSAVVTCGATTVDFENINTNTVKNTDDAIISTTVALNTVYTIDVWVYVNGDNAAVTSANATSANLGSFTVSMTLGID